MISSAIAFTAPALIADFRSFELDGTDSVDDSIQIDSRTPVASLRLDVLTTSVGLVLPCLQQLVNAGQHRVVFEFRQLDDAGTTRQDDIAVILNARAGSSETLPGGTRFRAGAAGHIGEAIPGAQELRFGTRPCGATGIEDGNRKLDARSGGLRSFRLAFAMHVHDDVAEGSNASEGDATPRDLDVLLRDCDVEPARLQESVELFSGDIMMRKRRKLLLNRYRRIGIPQTENADECFTFNDELLLRATEDDPGLLVKCLFV